MGGRGRGRRNEVRRQRDDRKVDIAWAFGEKGTRKRGVNAAHRFAPWKTFCIVHTGPAQESGRSPWIDHVRRVRGWRELS
jgi:hypothetical protein